jgi:hypothetical protein
VEVGAVSEEPSGAATARALGRWSARAAVLGGVGLGLWLAGTTAAAAEAGPAAAPPVAVLDAGTEAADQPVLPSPER